MTRPVIAEPCAFPGDLSLTDGVDVIRWERRHIFVNGYESHLLLGGLDDLARAVLNVVLDPVPAHLVTAFAEGWIALAGPAWVVGSDTVTAWIETYTGKYVHAGTLISRDDDARISRDGP